MDLTPPPSQSSASPPSTRYSVDISSPFISYPSPVLLAQKCRLSSLYGGTGPACAMTPPLDSEPPPVTLGAMSHPEWTQTSSMLPSTTSTTFPDVLATEYDPFGRFGVPVPTAFSTGLYPSAAPPTPKTVIVPGQSVSGAMPGSRQPMAHMPLPRSPIPFSGSAMPVPGSSVGPRVKMETPIPDYSQLDEVPHFSQSRQLQPRYSLEPTGMYAAGGSAGISGSYLSDSASTVWGGPIPTSTAPSHFYPAATAVGTDSAGSVSHPLRGRQNPPPSLTPERQLRVGRPPRRAPRRLTTKEEANFQCEVRGCGKLFSRSYNYKAHMETHDEKREYPFPCPVPECSKKFVRKTDLQRHHQSVHMKERNHKCDYCGRLFARKDTLRRHMDDGCSKRFDIGTLDLRTEGYGPGNSGTQDSLWPAR